MQNRPKLTLQFIVHNAGPVVVTMCEVYENGHLEAEGISVKMPQDKDNPDIGRRIALARAIKDESRSLRKEIFAEYEKREV